MTGSGRFRRAILGALLAGLGFAGSAHAAITGSNVAQPTDLSFLVSDSDNGPTDVTISGTTTGGAPGTDKVDLRCYYGSNLSYFVKGGVSTNPDGTFSTLASIGGIEQSVCVLRAIPAGSFPSDLTPFTGPRVATSQRQTFTIAGGPNAGTNFDYDFWGQQLTAAFDYRSLTKCSIFGGYLLDSAFNKTAYTFNCAGALDISDQDPGTRSGVQVDGANAYGPYSAQLINSLATGLPPITYSFTVDPATGNLVLHEADQLVKCPDATYPPTVAKCPSFVPTGVTDDRTITQDHDGHLTTIADAFTSTDAASHALDLLWENGSSFTAPFGAGNAANLAYQFPGESAFATHATGDQVTLPAAPGVILIHVNGVADGDQTTGQGAIVYDRPADFAKFIFADSFVQEFNLHQTGTVPAGGSATFTAAYAQDYTAAGVAALAGGVADRFSPPVVTIGAPANGTVVHTASVAVSGTAMDNVGVASLTVNGHPVSVGAGGPWSTNVALNQGANTITAVAHDAAGGTGQAQISVTYAPATQPPKPSCRVPKLRGKKLAAAKKALKKAHCGVGKVTKKKSKTVRKGRVIASKTKAGKKVAGGTKVRLTVAK